MTPRNTLPWQIANLLPDFRASGKNRSVEARVMANAEGEDIPLDEFLYRTNAI